MAWIRKMSLERLARKNGNVKPIKHVFSGYQQKKKRESNFYYNTAKQKL
jgi:hypothetical protein